MKCLSYRVIDGSIKNFKAFFRWLYVGKYWMMEGSTNDYDKCSKISNTYLFRFSNKMLLIRAGIHKMLVRIANREDHDQTAFEEAV